MFIAIRILFISAPLGAQCVMPLLTELQTVLECIRAINIARLTALNAGAEAIRYPSSSTLIYLSVGSSHKRRHHLIRQQRAPRR